MTILPDDCFLHDKDRLTHAQALTIICETLAPVTRIESVSIEEASGRILGRNLRAPRDVPGHSNAAVDGYAYCWSGTRDRRRVAQRVVAGGPAGAIERAGEAARIFTGAVMPEGADTVAMQEDCRVTDREVTLPRIRRGANVRLAGEDVAEGETIARAGDRLGPQDVAAIASIGEAEVPVRSRLRIGVLSTGSELLAPGAPFVEGGVYDSNRIMVDALVGPWGHAIDNLGRLPDDRGEIERVLSEAARRCDAIVTSGGASGGEEDHMVDILDRIGKRHLWQLAVKPGRPMLMGQVGDCILIGLPGNPVAAMVCTLLYARAVLAALAGERAREPRRFALPAAFAIRSKFLRGRMVGNGVGARVTKFERDGSGLITGLRESDGLIEIAEDRTEVAEGDPVAFIPYSEFGIQR